RRVCAVASKVFVPVITPCLYLSISCCETTTSCCRGQLIDVGSSTSSIGRGFLPSPDPPRSLARPAGPGDPHSALRCHQVPGTVLPARHAPRWQRAIPSSGSRFHQAGGTTVTVGRVSAAGRSHGEREGPDQPHHG